MSIIVHKWEGRPLLTDRNALYDDLLKELNIATIGYCLIILTHNKSQLLPENIITDDINILANKGD